MSAFALEPLSGARQRPRAAFLVALGVRLVLGAAVLGVLAGVVQLLLWEPSPSTEPAPAVEVCPDPPCLPASLPGAEDLLVVVAPLAYLLAALLGAVALLLSLLPRTRRQARRRLLPVVGPVAVLVAMEVVPHLVNPCLAASALGERLPAVCARTVHGVDVHDRWHALHHAAVGGVPAALAYTALLRRRRPELFARPAGS